MRTATVPILILFLAAPASVGAQAGRSATGPPEVFNATATAKSGSGSISGTVDVRITRYTPDFDRKTVEEALRLGGYPKFLTALRNAPEVGQLVLGGGQTYAIRYAREKVDAGARTLVVVTDKPVFFVGSGRTDAKPRAGFEVAVVEIQIDGAGRASGRMAAAARVRPDGNGGVLLDDYAEQLVVLTNIARKSL